MKQHNSYRVIIKYFYQKMSQKKQNISSYKRITWAAIVNMEEDAVLRHFKNWCFKQKYVDSKSKYATIRLLLSLAVKVLYNEKLGEFIDDLYRESYIKKGDLIEALNIMLLYAMDKMPKEM